MKRIGFVMVGVMLLGFFASLQAKPFENVAQSYIHQEIRYVDDALSFSIRRMRLRFCGSFGDGKFYYRVEPDLADAYSLKFAYCDIKYLAPYLNFRIGKFCAPSGLQLYWTWPPKEMIVHINPVQRRIWEEGDLFDYGLQVSGSYKFGPEAKVVYILAAQNGQGSAPEANPDQKFDYSVRANIVPIKGLQIGGWTQIISDYDMSLPDTIDERTLSGVDVWYTGYGLDIRAEYDMGDFGDNPNKLAPCGVKPKEYSGYYVMASYAWETPVEALEIGTMKLQPVINYAAYDPGIDGVDPVTTITPGLNLYLGENLKIMINYRMITDKHGAYYASAYSKEDGKQNVFEMRTQVLFK